MIPILSALLLVLAAFYLRTLQATLLLLALSALTILHTKSQLGANTPFYQSLAALGGPIFFYMLIYAVVHVYTQTAKREIDHLKHQNQLLNQESQSILLKFNRLNEIKENLEKRILRDDSFNLKLQEAVHQLASMDYFQMRQRILEITRDFVRAQSVSFYYYEDGDFILGSELNCPKLPRTYLADHPLVKRFANQEILSLKDPQPFRDFVLGGILRRQNHTPLGILFIHDMEFLDLNPQNVQLFHLLVNWLSIEMDKALVYDHLKLDMVKLENLRHFYQIVYNEFLSAKTYDIRTMILTLTFPDRQSLTKKTFEDNLMDLSMRMGEVLQSVNNEVFFNEIREDRMHILLPMQSKEKAEAIYQKIKGEGFSYKVDFHLLALESSTDPLDLVPFLDEHFKMVRH